MRCARARADLCARVLGRLRGDLNCVWVVFWCQEYCCGRFVVWRSLRNRAVGLSNGNTSVIWGVNIRMTP